MSVLCTNARIVFGFQLIGGLSLALLIAVSSSVASDRFMPSRLTHGNAAVGSHSLSGKVCWGEAWRIDLGISSCKALQPAEITLSNANGERVVGKTDFWGRFELPLLQLTGTTKDRLEVLVEGRRYRTTGLQSDRFTQAADPGEITLWLRYVENPGCLRITPTPYVDLSRF